MSAPSHREFQAAAAAALGAWLERNVVVPAIEWCIPAPTSATRVAGVRARVSVADQELIERQVLPRSQLWIVDEREFRDPENHWQPSRTHRLRTIADVITPLSSQIAVVLMVEALVPITPVPRGAVEREVLEGGGSR